MDEHHFCLQVYQRPWLSLFKQQIRKETQANKHRRRRKKNRGPKPVERERTNRAKEKKTEQKKKATE